MCESWLGAMEAPSSAQSCDRTSRLGVKAIAHLDKRYIKELRSKISNNSKGFSIILKIIFNRSQILQNNAQYLVSKNRRKFYGL